MNRTRQAGLFDDILPNQLIHLRSIEQSPKCGPKVPDGVPGHAAAEFSVQPLLYPVPGQRPERYLPEGGQNVGFKVVVIEKVLTSSRVLQLFTGRYVSDDGKQASFTISLRGDHLQLLEEGPGHSPLSCSETMES
jgi:hypothetical protein